MSSNPTRGVLDTTLSDKVGQRLATGLWFSLGTPVSPTNETDRHDIAEILMKVALSTITLALHVKDQIHQLDIVKCFKYILYVNIRPWLTVVGQILRHYSLYPLYLLALKTSVHKHALLFTTFLT